jgi:hypothetical protein
VIPIGTSVAIDEVPAALDKLGHRLRLIPRRREIGLD